MVYSRVAAENRDGLFLFIEGLLFSKHGKYGTTNSAGKMSASKASAETELPEPAPMSMV